MENKIIKICLSKFRIFTFLIKEEVNARSFIEPIFVTGQGFVTSKT